MKTDWLLIVVLATSAVGGFALWLIGAEQLRLMAMILIVGLVLIGAMAGSALPIRAYRKRDATGETHYYHDGTKTVVRETRIDGRQITSPEVKLLQLPQTANGQVFPELLRAAYQSGALARQGSGSAQVDEIVEGEVRELEGWGGEIHA